MAADVIFPPVHTYNDIQVNLDIYHQRNIKQLKSLKIRKANVCSPLYAQLISSIIFFISSICQACIFDALRCSSIKGLAFSSSLLCSSIFDYKYLKLALSSQTSLECISCDLQVEELLPIFWDLGLGPQPRPF